MPSHHSPVKPDGQIHSPRWGARSPWQWWFYTPPKVSAACLRTEVLGVVKVLEETRPARTVLDDSVSWRKANMVQSYPNCLWGGIPADKYSQQAVRFHPRRSKLVLPPGGLGDELTPVQSGRLGDQNLGVRWGSNLFGNLPLPLGSVGGCDELLCGFSSLCKSWLTWPGEVGQKVCTRSWTQV